MRLIRLQPALLAAAVAALACGGLAPSSPAGPADRLQGELDIFAAASLTESFNALGTAFREAHPSLTVHLVFAGTPTLVTQIAQGAPADILASADGANMQNAVDQGLVAGTPRVFARNRLAIVVGAGNPKHLAGLADLARPDVLFITEAATVPAGRYAAQALASAGVKASPRSFESDVKSVVAKVSLGEADAGIVYLTDVRAAGPKVAGVVIPDGQNVITSYPVATLRGSRNSSAGQAFLEQLFSAPGQTVLAHFGFSPP